MAGLLGKYCLALFAHIATTDNPRIINTAFFPLKRWVMNRNRTSEAKSAGRNHKTFIPCIPSTYHNWMNSVLRGTTLVMSNEYSTMRM